MISLFNLGPRLVAHGSFSAFALFQDTTCAAVLSLCTFSFLHRLAPVIFSIAVQSDIQLQETVSR